MFKYKLILFSALLMLQGCLTQDLTYFEVKPFVNTPVRKVDQPLYVKFSKRIDDKFSVAQQGFTLHVSDFHRSLQYAAGQLYTHVFSDVKSYMPSDAGFILEVQQLDAVFDVKEIRTATTYTSEWYCVMNYTGTLYRNELHISQATGTVRIKLGDNIHSVSELYKEAVKQAFEQMASAHFKVMKL
ncbi:MAG: hypothetical protein ACK4Y6_04575 [Bacteroidota bacterium]|jgi:hypothetical protein